ncbi:MAG: hypothetical protein ACPG9U_08555, partial [Paracoccaceae bacterium]
GMTTNGASPAAWQMLPQQWVGCCNHIKTSAKHRLVCGFFYLPNSDISLDIIETLQQVHDGKLWLANAIFSPFYAPYFMLCFITERRIFTFSSSRATS